MTNLRSRQTGPSVAVRASVMVRADNCCERCGVSVVNVPASIHHRLSRGSGGTRRSDVNDPANLALLCGTGTTGCHGHIESHPAHAYATGWKIRRNSIHRNPENIPLTDVHGNRFLFIGWRRIDINTLTENPC